MDEDEDANAVAERLKQRYGQGQYVVGEYRGDAERVPMQFLLPTAKDGNLWLVKCKVGFKCFARLLFSSPLAALCSLHACFNYHYLGAYCNTFLPPQI